MSAPNTAVKHLVIVLVAAACVAASLPAAEPSPAKSRLGMNLAGPADWTTEHAFVDVFRLSRQWISQQKGAGWGKGPELQRDANGWVKRLDDDCWAETPVLTHGHAPSGEYVCLYDGEGEVTFNNVRRVVSKEPGRIVVDIDGRKGGVFVALRKTNPANYVRNIRLLMPGCEKTYKAEPFNRAFLDRWQGMNTYRFMDWMHTNGSKISRWEDRPTTAYCNFTEKGIPVEVMVDLCNRQKINPWFCMPHLATDDYVRNFAKYVKEHLDPSLVVYVEYSNEVWNSQFAQTKYAGDEGLKLKFGDKHWEAGWRYSAYRSVQMFKIWEEVFGGPKRLVRVIASQCVTYVSERKLEFQDAYKHCDALAIAPYIGLNVPERGSDKQPGAAEVAQWPLEKLLDHVEQNRLPEAIKYITDHKKLADKYGVKLVAYEAGQHLVGVQGGENNDALCKLFWAANRHPRMGAVYTKYMDAWRAAGGDLMAIFSSTGAWSKWGSWGVCEFMEDTEQDQPKLKAVLEWNRKNVR